MDQRDRRIPTMNYNGPQSQNVRTVKNNDGQEYDQCGNYFQCVKCDQFTIHQDNDRICENSKCITNKKKPVVTQMNKYKVNKQCTNCHKLLASYEQIGKYNGYCYKCYSRIESNTSRQQRSEFKSSVHGRTTGGSGGVSHT